MALLSCKANQPVSGWGMNRLSRVCNAGLGLHAFVCVVFRCDGPPETGQGYSVGRSMNIDRQPFMLGFTITHGMYCHIHQDYHSQPFLKFK